MTGEGTIASAGPGAEAGAVDSGSARRNRSIRRAVLTSVLSKGGTVLLQLLSIPVAVRVLGKEEFGLYTTVNFTLSTVALLEIGIGPALAHGLSGARARGDREGVGELASTAFFLILGMALLAGILLATVLTLTPLPLLFGQQYAASEAALRPALWTGLALFLLLFVLNLTDRVREGMLEAAANNLWGAGGNLLAATAVGVGIQLVPQVWYLVLAVHGSLVVAKVGNTLALWRRYPEMRPAWTRARPAVARHLFGDGLAFSSCTLVAGLVEYNFCGWLVGRTAGPGGVALYGVFVTLTILQLGFVMMVSTPTWPAVAEALARGDRAWARGAARRLYRYGMAFALCSAAGLIVLGPWVFPLWLGEGFGEIGRLTLACYAAYFVAHVWRHLQHTLMIGTGQVRRLARIQFLESALVAAAAWAALHWGGVGGMLLTTALLVAGITGVFLPRQVARALARG